MTDAEHDPTVRGQLLRALLQVVVVDEHCDSSVTRVSDADHFTAVARGCTGRRRPPVQPLATAVKSESRVRDTGNRTVAVFINDDRIEQRTQEIGSDLFGRISIGRHQFFTAGGGKTGSCPGP